MEKEKLFLYQLCAALYKSGCHKLDISNETLRQVLPYLKSMIREDRLDELGDLFYVDDDGLYSNYLNHLNNFDPLFGKRENNEMELYLNDNMVDLFADDDTNYIGEKLAIYIKIKEKEKNYYANN